jgi:UDP-N-acetylmuramoyl-tripeptide--D-alanyl-D-alanine ligase
MTVPAAILWTAGEAAAATQGQAIVGKSGGKGADCWRASGVSIDSRTLRPGDLFVAIEGPNHDGHAFAADAFDKGAVAAIVARRPENVADDAPLLMVGDTFDALGGLGRAARGRANAKVIAVTGSVGKTGTKDAITHVLKSQGAAHASAASLNNHWGLPLSLARMPRGTDFAIFEMGMNHAGEISPLSKMARPHVAMVTAVETAHGEFFTGVDAIADAKAEIFEGVEPGGWAVIKRDMPYFHRLARAAAACGVENVIGFGVHDDADARLVGSTGDGDAGGSRVTAIIGGNRIDYRIALPGSHWVMNSLGVLAAVHAVGGDVAAAAAALGGLRAQRGRGLRHRVSIPGGAITVIDDSYNASPASMKAAFEVLAQSIPGPGGRRIAVLGEMLELGAGSAAAHASLAEPLSDFSIDLVFTAGAEMAHLAEAIPESRQGGHGADSQAMAPMVAAAVKPGDVVTVKGSAAGRMSVVVAALLELGRGEEA